MQSRKIRKVYFLPIRSFKNTLSVKVCPKILQNENLILNVAKIPIIIRIISLQAATNC